jgi:hypothetical protein
MTQAPLACCLQVVVDVPHDRAAPPVIVQPSLDWDAARVLVWLAEVGLGALVPRLEAAAPRWGVPITGQALLNAPLDELPRQLRIPCGDVRERFVMEVAKLRSMCCSV